MKLKIYYKNKEVNVLIAKHKNKDVYSFVNLDSHTISPCEFDSIELAIRDFVERDDYIRHTLIDIVDYDKYEHKFYWTGEYL